MFPSVGDSGHLPGMESVSLPPLQTQREVAMLLVHSFPQPSPLGLPARVLLDLATESHGPGYRRTLRVQVDDKQVWCSAGRASGNWVGGGGGLWGSWGQPSPRPRSHSRPRGQVSEELTFTRQPEHVSLSYTLWHNVPVLRTLWRADKLGLQVSLGERR